MLLQFKTLAVPLLGAVIGFCLVQSLNGSKPRVHHVATYWTSQAGGRLTATGIFSVATKDCDVESPIAILSPLACLTSSKIPTKEEVTARGLEELGFTLMLNTTSPSDIDVPVRLATKRQQIPFIWKVRASECLLLGEPRPTLAGTANISANASSVEEHLQYHSIVER